MEIINTDNAPSAIGPYSQAVKSNGFLFVSGQIPLKTDGNLLEGDISEQTEQVMMNMKSILEEAGLDFGKVVKTTIYLADMNDFEAVNEVYGNYFGQEPPARATVEVGRLPKDVKVEIDAVAEL